MLSINGNTALVTSSPPGSILNVDINKVSAKQPAPVMQSRPPLLELPDELETELLLCLIAGRAPVQSAQLLGNLGLSCTHWSLRVRKYIESADGHALRRAVEVARFRKQHRMSPVDAYRDTTSSGHMIHNEFPSLARKSNKTAIDCMKNCTADLMTSAFPVHLTLYPGEQWLNQAMCDALATRGNKLTILEFNGLTKAGLGEMITAIQQVPRGGFVALDIEVNDKLSAADADELFAAIAAHPVVCHLTLSANKTAEGDSDACAWLATMVKHNTCIGSVRIDVDAIATKNANLLANLINQQQEIRDLEILENYASAESMQILFDAVRARNASNTTQLTLHYSPINQRKLIDVAANGKILSEQGIEIRQPGAPWRIQLDAVAVLEESSEEDHSIEVGSYSSGDDALDREFKWAGDSDSDVVVDNTD